VNNAHIKQFTEKYFRDSPAYSRCSAVMPCSRAAFEAVMSTKQNNTWAFQDPDSSPCSLCCVSQTM